MSEEDQIIPAPKAFFQTFEEGLEQDIYQIKQYYETLSKKSNFILPNYLSKERSLLKEKINKNIRESRQIILLYMSNQPEYSFFNLPSSDTILSSTQQEAKRLFDESFRHTFKGIRKNPTLFAQIVHKYFSQNLDSLFCFCWSTFPSTYNFFSTNYYTECGYNFINQFLSSNSPTDIKITDYLLPPFFMCAFEFSSKFWLKISYDISEKARENDEFFDFFIDSIYTCSCYLSFYHKSIIDFLYHFDSNRCLSFLFNDFLKKTLEIVSKNGDFLFSLTEVEFINKAFDEYSKLNEDDEKVKKIISAFTFGHENKDETEGGVPKMPDFQDFEQVISIISSYDVGLLLEIFQFSEDNEELRTMSFSTVFQLKIESNFQKGFLPVIITDISPYEPNIEKSVFPTELDGYWKTIVSMSNGKDVDPMLYYKQNIEMQVSDSSLMNNEQLLKYQNNTKSDKFVYLNQIYIYERNYRILNHLLEIELRIKENNLLSDSLHIFLQPLLFDQCEQKKYKAFNFSIPFEKVKSNKVSECIKNAVRSIMPMKEMEGFDSFMIFCSVLNSFQIESDEIFLKLTDGFLNTIKSEKDNIQNLMLAYRKVRHVVDKLCLKIIGLLESKLLGTQFKGILQFVEYIQNIDSELYNEQNGGKSKFKLFFKYSLCVLNHHAVFDVYLIAKMVFKRNQELLDSFDEKIKNNYLLFDSSVRDFLSIYKQDIRCLSYIQGCV